MSILWPITVVGGCIAVAALGVMGLYLTGSSSDGEIITSAATTGTGPLDGADSDLLTDRRASPALEPLASDNDPVDGGEISQDPSELLEDVPATTTTVGPATTTSETGGVTPLSPASAEAQPALYRDASLVGGPVASVVKVDQFLITSASAVAGHETLSLWVDGTWTTVDIVHRDMLSDVALVVPSVPLAELDIPTVDVGTSVKPGAVVYLGYCEIGPGPDIAEVSAPGCGVGVVKRVRPPAESGEEEPIEAEAETALVDPEVEIEGSESNSKLGTLNEQDSEVEPEADPSTDPELSDARAGKVYSLTQTLRTRSNHLIYEPIRTQISQADGIAGAPLREADGQIVGLVVGSTSPSVSALPIERALAVAESFAATGHPSSNWIGLDGRSSEEGLVVTSVDPSGPAAGVASVGDLIVEAAGQPLTEPDHLIHLVRQSEPGAQLQVVVRVGDEDYPRTIVVGVLSD